MPYLSGPPSYIFGRQDHHSTTVTATIAAITAVIPFHKILPKVIYNHNVYLLALDMPPSWNSVTICTQEERHYYRGPGGGSKQVGKSPVTKVSGGAKTSGPKWMHTLMQWMTEGAFLHSAEGWILEKIQPLVEYQSRMLKLLIKPCKKFNGQHNHLFKSSKTPLKFLKRGGS